MSLKSSFIKLVIKLTPDKMIIWVANVVLKGIAELTEFSFDLDTRKVHLKTRLYGEESSIEIELEDFAVFSNGEYYCFILNYAVSDRLWLNNILSRIVGKAWKIPEIPQLAPYLALIAEVFTANIPALEKID